MEVLFFILMIIFVAVTGGKKKPPRNAGNAAARGAAMRSAPVQKAMEKRMTAEQFRQRMEALKREAPEAVEDILPPKKAERAEVKPVKVAGQSSPVFMAASRAVSMPAPVREPGILDEEGCVGGSIEHTHHEGESRAEHREHLEKIRRQEEEETLSAQAARELADLNIHRLRRAIVVSEILGKPKALQRR